MKRVFLMVLDSVGIGELPDAALYGDEGSNTVKAAATSPYFSMPNMLYHWLKNHLHRDNYKILI